MEIIETDIAIIGAGAAGISAAIAIAEIDPNVKISLISKVYPMRSHTCAAEGGAAGVAKPEDSLDKHFDDTVAGGDWLCDQDAVEWFVEQAPKELARIERWGCPWSRDKDGNVAVRPFGGMKVERTWYAADKTGFHILHTLFQTSLQYPSIQRFDEYYSTDLIADDGRCQGVTAIDMRSGQLKAFAAKSVIIATGGAGRVFPFTTNGAIKTGDGMAMAYRAGVPLKDMEFVQYHPTGLPGTGILMTEGCRGEGGILVNKDGYRYLQDYGMGPPDPWPRKKAMELGPRDILSQAFWHEQQKGRTIQTPHGDVVHLDMRHLGEALIDERLPFVRDLARSYMGVDMVHDPVPVRPVVHYTMGGIDTDRSARTPLDGLFAAGECACVSINGSNRLGSNSLTECLVFGREAGKHAAEQVAKTASPNAALVKEKRDQSQAALAELFMRTNTGESVSGLRREMNDTMESGAGIYRSADSLSETCKTVAQLRDRFNAISLEDKSNVYNTDLIQALELKSMIEVAETMAHSALQRRESRGSHQRLDVTERDDKNFLKHTLVQYQGADAPSIDYRDVVITKSQPGQRVYGGEK
ncbi:fumarate reductase (quinol) flavoprotein subunit [Magnetospira sp. QH-2]|uniref:fumarate reductase (quinol) flavoprotein subunit n=1 Tax=Magnetospira sp. (strain QH-2) TaxID=1288970 RepID=UPI0003E8183C|nr:fumarate reductase (quinol) flavoprotein subunit [Magnetospira sp. QH-2]CCQ75195.1 Fumarate reductase flavoprotein subunit [Magnetospira sp. QH-2]